MEYIELKISFPKEWNVSEERLLDGSRVFTCLHLQEDVFKLVPASQLSVDDEFLQHVPITNRERGLMYDVKKAIADGISDFWCPICNPSLDDKDRIWYKPGMSTARGKTCAWWKRKAEEFFPSKGSRLGTKREYDIFLAVLIKEMVAAGWNVADAWSAVCNDSKELGHYRNSKDAKRELEPTGSREVCGWYDLANTYKIVTSLPKIAEYRLVSGAYFYTSDSEPLRHFMDTNYDNEKDYSCGWIVLTEAP